MREKNVKGKIMHEKYKRYFNINYKTFPKKYPSIMNDIHDIGKKSLEIKGHLLEVFSEKKWNLLSDDAKS